MNPAPLSPVMVYVLIFCALLLAYRLALAALEYLRARSAYGWLTNRRDARLDIASRLLASWSTQQPQSVDTFLIAKALIDADMLIAASNRTEDENLEAGAADYVPPQPTGVYPAESYVPNLGDVMCGVLCEGGGLCLLNHGHDGDHEPAEGYQPAHEPEQEQETAA